MDPIGLAFEKSPPSIPIARKKASSPLKLRKSSLPAKKFSRVAELKHILATERKRDFHRCLSEKLLTYATGRGEEYYDAPAIDEIVRRMESQHGSLHEAVLAVIDSVAFQRLRQE